MKYYAVKKGFEVGIYDNWDDCQKNTKGFKGALYKSFSNIEDAEKYMKENEKIEDSKKLVDDSMSLHSVESLKEDELIIYSDGSYNSNLKLSSYGIVYIQKNCKDIYSSGIVDDTNNSQNVIGEITGVLKGLEYAKKLNKKRVYIYHDYEGLSKWINGEWKLNSSDAVKYSKSIKKYKENFEIEFVKVKSHAGEKYNEICDKLAKNELKSLEPSKSSEWGFKSFRFSDEQIDKVLNNIHSDIDTFEFTVNDNNNHNAYKCFLGKEKLTFQKYKFDSTNQLIIPMNQSQKIYSIILTYLNEYNSVNSMIRSLNVNNNTEYAFETIENRLYSIAPALKGKKINTSIYKLLLQATYNLFLKLDDFVDCGFLTTPVLRALEGHLKQLFKDKLGLEVTSNFGYFDKDLGTGIYTLQQIHANKLHSNEADYINRCYNKYCMIRHKLLHFGDLEIEDTKIITREEALAIIGEIIGIIEEYYK